MFGNVWHKKEKPILGLTGMGGGATSLARKSAAPAGDPASLLFAMFGGGGAGGGWTGGGGGGGGYVSETVDFTAGTPYAITIGEGGAAPPSSVPPAPNGLGTPGGNSTFVTDDGTFTAYGGGGGCSVGLAGLPGGSGGGGQPQGGGEGNVVTGTANPASASPPQPTALSQVQNTTMHH